VSDPASRAVSDPASRAVSDPASRAVSDPALRAVSDPAFRAAERSVAGPHAVELAGLLHELSARLLAADEVPQALDRLAAFAVRAVPGAYRCSVALIGENAPLTVAGAEAGGRTPAEDFQYSLGQGPGLDAARTRALVTTADLGTDARWPELAARTRTAGAGYAVAAIPLDVDRASVGALCVYVAHPRTVDPDVLLTAMAIVNQAEIMLSEVHRRAHRTAGAAVDRAAGVIIAQRGCGVGEAYDVLHDTANRLGLDRLSVAERLIAAAARNADRAPTPS
jgi:hypothetical protein